MLVAAKDADRPHHEATLDRGETAQTAVAAFELLADQAVHGGRQTGATRSADARAEQSHRSEFADQLGRECAGSVVGTDQWQEAGRDEFADGLLGRTFLVGELAGEAVEVDTCVRLHVASLLYGWTRCSRSECKTGVMCERVVSQGKPRAWQHA